MSETTKNMKKKEKKEKKEKEQHITIPEPNSSQKEKKSKKRKTEKNISSEEIENIGVVDTSAAPRKKKKVKSSECEPESTPSPQDECTEERAVTVLNWGLGEKEEVKDAEATDASTSNTGEHKDDKALKQHEKQLKNKLPTRQERQRRDNQKKMQAFVAEMRAKGKSKEEINKLKKKVNAKLKHIQPNQEFSSVVSLGDISLSCRECHADFTFSVQEQQFYQQQQYPPPVRCKECTAAKKVRMAGFDKKDSGGRGAWGGYQQQGYSNNSNSNSYSNNNNSYDYSSSSGGGGGGTRSNWGNL